MKLGKTTATVVALALAGCTMFGPSTQDVAAKLTSALSGEPVNIVRNGNTITLTSSADYLYPSGGYDLRPGAPVLSKMVPTFTKFRHTTIDVTGYTDNTPIGPQLQGLGITNNQVLSQKRADMVVSYFVSQGVLPSLLTAHGLGEANPVASNDTSEGRARNRRVEIVVTGDGS
jgi:chemotaxis protein MotB